MALYILIIDVLKRDSKIIARSSEYLDSVHLCHLNQSFNESTYCVVQQIYLLLQDALSHIRALLFIVVEVETDGDALCPLEWI